MRTMVKNGCSPAASFNNDRLTELADQPIQSEFTASVAEQETSVTEISTEFLSTSIIMITQIMDHFTSNDLDYKWGPRQSEVILKYPATENRSVRESLRKNNNL